MPMLPVSLTGSAGSEQILALLDTGSTVNVLPYAIGVRLGAVWDEQPTELQLTGGLAGVPARVLVLTATVGSFAPVRLAFAWARHNSMPTILGQTNFFAEFDVCFFRTALEFEVRPEFTG